MKLTDYIHKKPKVKSVTSSKFVVVEAHQEPSTWGEHKLAKQISKLFGEIKRRQCGKCYWESYKENSPSFTCFFKLAKKFIHYQNQYKIRVNIVDFLLAHFDWWGKETYPGHLLGANAFDFYHKFQKRRYVTLVRSNEGGEKEMFEYLCQVRKETSEQLMRVLGKSEIFSEEFLGVK